MAEHPMWRRDSTKPVRADDIRPGILPPESVPPDPGAPASNQSVPGKAGSDFAELAAKFAAHGSGRVTKEVSGELALDVVLNEIVEQARPATGATGAAIALARDGEMVCRASSGRNAPELGMRLDISSGLSGACMRTRRIQGCPDALADPSADAEASRQLGVRSVVVLPLLLEEELIGIFEIFSSQPSAFGDQDLQTLDGLAGRIIENVRALRSSLVPGPLVASAQVSGGAPVGFTPGSASAGFDRGVSAQVSEEEGHAYEETGVRIASGWRFDWLATVLGMLVLSVAVLMGIALGMRLGWLKVRPGRHASRVAATPSSSVPATANGRGVDPSSAAEPTPSLPSSQNPSEESESAPAEAADRTNAGVPEGSLRVYENGREIFQMAPSGAETAAGIGKEKEKSGGAALALRPARIVELSPDNAEDSLVRRVEPQYPEQARLHQVQGAVLLDVRIGRDGVVQEVKLVSGNQLLADAAMTAVRQWRFKPHFVNGNAADMETKITLKFTLPSN